MKKILICGYYGHSNWGDEAILAGMLKLLACASPGIECTVFTSNPPITKQQHGIKTAYLKPIYGSGLPAKLLRFRNRDWPILLNDYFILGGGDLVRDSVDGDVAGNWLDLLAQAIKFQKKAIVLGISVGEVWKKKTIKKIPKLLNQSRFIGVRDHLSLLKLKELGVDSEKLILTPDLALKVIPDSCKVKNLRSYSSVKSRFKIGVSLRDIAVRGRELQSVNIDAFIKNLSHAFEIAQTSCCVEITFVPFQGSRDLDVITKLLKRISCPDNLKVLDEVKSLEDLLSQISQFDLIIGMRLHSVILAIGLGLPVIAISYDAKVRNFMSDLGQADFTIELADFTSEKLTSRIDRIRENYHVISEDFENSLEQYIVQWNLAMPKLLRALDIH